MFYFDFFLQVLAVSSIVYGSFFSLYQYKIKRLIAASAINHMGHVLLAFSIFSLSGLQAAFIYLIIYIMLSLNFFAILLAFRQVRSFNMVSDIVKLAAMARSSPLLAFMLSFNILSMAGIPPLMGFFGKYYVFYSLVMQHNYILAALVILASVLSSIYYFS